jgi:glutamate racemase
MSTRGKIKGIQRTQKPTQLNDSIPNPESLISTAPIGIFDSGIGGLTVAHTLVQHLPNERIIYFGDTKHLPYGEKSAAAIRGYSLRIAEFLLEKGCKCLVVACNSATAAAIEDLQAAFGHLVPIIDVVEPLVQRVAAQNFTKVGVIATRITIASGKYQDRLHALQPTLEVAALATPLLVPMIEEGFFSDTISDAVIHNYLKMNELQDLDALLLSCTHYPLIRKEIESYYTSRNKNVQVFDSNLAVAEAVAHILQQKNILNTTILDKNTSPKHQFFVSDYTPSFAATTRIFWGNEKVELEQVDIF